MKRVVIALGGNALIKNNQEGNIYEQFENTRKIMNYIVKIIEIGCEVVITHGNGPQVGSILLQNDFAKELTPPMPLGICVAESEGMIGYMIQQCLYNSLKKKGIDKDVVTLITQVLIDENDISLDNPTKPIGPFYLDEDIDEIKKDGYIVNKFESGWRIVVPSPDPKAIIEAKIVCNLLDEGVIVIASGGGGMPVIEKKGWGLSGIEAVIDKDLASERLAEQINAEILLILTNVEYVYKNYNMKNQMTLSDISLKELKKYYHEGHFPDGSMGPKVLAAIRFLENGGKKVIISHVEKGWKAFNGETGTQITK
jgi:carbamate kinase